MSNTLGIFGNLTKYLYLRSLGNKDAERYYLNQFQSNKHSLRDNDIAPNFTDAVVELGTKMREVDVSASVSPTLKSKLIEKANEFIKNLPKEDHIEVDDSNVKHVSLTGSELKKQLQSVYPNMSKLVINDKVGSVQEVITSAINDITTFINTVYTVSHITGDNSTVATVLKKLQKGEGSEPELHLFKNYAQVLHNGINVPNFSTIDTNKLSEYRINFRTKQLEIGIQTGGKGSLVAVPEIALLLPEVEVGVQVGYNSKQKYSVDEDKKVAILREVFRLAYLGLPVKTLLPDFSDANTNTDLELDLSGTLREALLQESIPSASLQEDEENVDAAFRRNAWTKLSNGKWSHNLDDGTQVTYDMKEDNEDLTRQLARCDVYGLKNKDCANFLRAISDASDNLAELVRLVSSMPFEVTAETVADMIPAQALLILRKFGFRRRVCNDRIAGSIVKVQRVKEWKKKFLEKKFDTVQMDTIKANQKFFNFLDLLAQLVNSNPSTLNDSYVGNTEESTGEWSLPEVYANQGVVNGVEHKRGRRGSAPALDWSALREGMNRIYGGFAQGLKFNGTESNSPFGNDNIFPMANLATIATGVVGGGRTSSMTGGGGDAKPVFLDTHTTRPQFTNEIVGMMKKLVANLNNNGKILSNSDVNSITEKVNQFEKLENQLYETAKRIQDYSQLIKVAEMSGRRETVTEDHIKQYIEKYNSLLGRYDKTGNTLSSLMSLLTECAGSDASCKTDGAL
jgi:hypothetical protein